MKKTKLVKNVLDPVKPVDQIPLVLLISLVIIRILVYTRKADNVFPVFSLVKLVIMKPVV